jgi:hypothetical protein
MAAHCLSPGMLRPREWHWPGAAGILILAVFALPAVGQTQAVPTIVAPPQQMTPYSVEAPAAYPSTDPSSARGANPFAPPPLYPSTAVPAASPVPLPYDRPVPPLMASANAVPNANLGPTLSSTPATPGGPANSAPLANFGGPTAVPQAANSGAFGEPTLLTEEQWSWQVLPTGLMYPTYLAGNREPRLGSELVYIHKLGTVLDATIGGRVGLLRYGTDTAMWAQGWQLDVEAAAFPRLDANRNLVDCDYRFGVPLTTRQGPFEMKFGYLHYCSHIGDLYLLANPDFDRINFTRDSIIWGLAVYLTPDVRLYSEADWAFHNDGGSEPWHFQFGVDFSSTEPTGPWGSPFAAVNGLIRQENNFSGNVTFQAGWQWRGQSGHLLRLGLQYFNGLSDEMQFYTRFEQQIGGGLWYDF